MPYLIGMIFTALALLSAIVVIYLDKKVDIEEGR